MSIRYILGPFVVLAVGSCSSVPPEDEFESLHSIAFVAQEIPAAAPPPGEFPRSIAVGDGAAVVIHAPQIASWRHFESIEGVAAVEARLGGDQPGRFMVMAFRADTEIDLDTRTIELTDLEVTSVTENGLEVGGDARRLLEEALPEARSVPLDLGISYLAEDAVPTSVEGLSVEPPDVFVSQQSAVLVLYHGEPVMAPIAGSELRFAANTNWSVFHDPASDVWYLRNDDTWLKSSSAQGPWTWADELPAALGNLPDDDNWRSTRKAVAAWGGAPAFPAPLVFVSTAPAELILLVGEPELEAIGETGLEFVRNTESQLFRHGDLWYYLVSGRWFSAGSLTDAWTYVDALPAAFRAIPASHAKATVRASVPGTPEATMAAIEASVPRKTEIPNDTALPIEVTYLGEPTFEPIEETTLKRALNTPYQVIQASDGYYLCYGGVWYRSDQADGPWVLAQFVPAEIYAIPPTSPLYAVTDVKVYDTSPETTTFVYSASYSSNIYVYNGVPVYGTGWYYPAYYYPYQGYPVYYGYPVSYGGASIYNTSTGAYVNATRAYGPYGGWGYAAGYNPATGRYGRAEAYYDYDEWWARGEAYNPQTNRYFGTERYYSAADGDWTIESRVDGARGGADVTRNFNDSYGEATVRTDGGGSGSFQRRASEGGWDSSGSFSTADGRTVTSSGSYAEGTGSSTFTGSDGASATITRSVDDDGVTREGSFTKDDRSVQTSTTRNAGQSTTSFETSEGGRGAVTGSPGQRSGAAVSGSGDLYAGSDGSVYRRTGSGWEKHAGNDSWTSLQREQLDPAGRHGSTLERDFRARDRGLHQSRGGGLRARRR